jgi:hypothetical protein
MVGGYAIATSCELRLLLAIAGLIFTLVWFYLSERGRKEITIFWEKGKKCEAELAEEEQVLTPVDEARKKFCWFWKLQARIILSWILPLGWAVVWSVILIMSATGVF